MKLNTKPLSEVQSGRPMVADGVYYALLKGTEIKNSAKGTQYIPLAAKILDVEVQNTEGEPLENNGRLYAYGSLGLTENENYDPNEKCREIAESMALDIDNGLELEDLNGSNICKIKTKFKPAETYTDANGAQKQAPAKVEIANFVPMTQEELDQLDFPNAEF